MEKILITNYKKTEEFDAADRVVLTEKYRKAAAAADGQERDRLAFIANALSLGATEINVDEVSAIYPEGSEGAKLDNQMGDAYSDFDF
ncbi:MAG: hypothetical protein HUK14_02750 [Muribaculaceae bacterium]|nr:hypothetical protein [Muribaculaceae bacterium]